MEDVLANIVPDTAGAQDTKKEPQHKALVW